MSFRHDPFGQERVSQTSVGGHHGQLEYLGGRKTQLSDQRIMLQQVLQIKPSPLPWVCMCPANSSEMEFNKFLMLLSHTVVHIIYYFMYFREH